MDIDQIYLGDNLAILRDVTRFPDSSIDCVITSPPYFQQRDYNNIGMGNEKTFDEYCEILLQVFDQCYRVVKSTGTIVFNIGDKYEDGNLLLAPYRIAIAIQNRYGKSIKLVNDLTWVKSNPTPRQDGTKLISSTEPFFIFAKGKHYFNKTEFQAERKVSTKTKISLQYGNTYRDLIEQSELSAEEKSAAHAALQQAVRDVRDGLISGIRMKIRGIHALAYGGNEGGRNNQIKNQGFTIIRLNGETMKRDVIEQAVETIKGNQHPAVFPTSLIETLLPLLVPNHGIVLDPFMGSGTTAIAAKNLKRHYIGIEVDPIYHAYAIDRLKVWQPQRLGGEYFQFEDFQSVVED